MYKRIPKRPGIPFQLENPYPHLKKYCKQNLNVSPDTMRASFGPTVWIFPISYEIHKPPAKQTPDTENHPKTHAIPD